MSSRQRSLPYDARTKRPPTKTEVKPEVITAIMNERGSLAPTDLHLGGTKYKVIQGEAGAVIRGKKGPGGVTVKKTTMSLIIGVYDEPMTPGQCNMNVESLGDYIIPRTGFLICFGTTDTVVVIKVCGKDPGVCGKDNGYTKGMQWLFHCI